MNLDKLLFEAYNDELFEKPDDKKDDLDSFHNYHGILYSKISKLKIYEGYLCKDTNSRNGFGVEYYDDDYNTEEYIGQFKNDKRDGQGKVFWPETKIVNSDGEFTDGKKNG